MDYIYPAITMPGIRVLVQNAMQESEMVLHRCFGAPLMNLQERIRDLLYRFTNKALKYLQRIGGASARKLSPADRLIGYAILAMEEGFTPAYIAVGAAKDCPLPLSKRKGRRAILGQYENCSPGGKSSVG